MSSYGHHRRLQLKALSWSSKGNGGIGKSTVGATLARPAARNGLSVPLVELERKERAEQWRRQDRKPARSRGEHRAPGLRLRRSAVSESCDCDRIHLPPGG